MREPFFFFDTLRPDLSPNNILAGLGPQDSGLFSQIEELELAHPRSWQTVPSICRTSCRLPMVLPS